MSQSTENLVRALEESFRVRGAASPVDLVVQYEIVDEHATTVHHLVLGPSGDRAVEGAAQRSDATFRVSREIADDILAGRRSAESAFLSGDLTLVGDATALVRAHLARLDA